MNFIRKLFTFVFLSIVGAWFLISFFGKKVNPIVESYLDTEVERIISNTVESTVNEVLAQNKCDDLISITKNTQDEIEIIDYDSSVVNSLLMEINKKIYYKLSQLEEGQVKQLNLSSSLLGYRFQHVRNGLVCEIPLGSLSGNSFLSNLGPVIPIKISFLGGVTSNLKTKVTNYGINNLIMQLYIQVEIKGRISLPKSTNVKTVKIDAPLSMRIIPGKVPDYYGGIIGKNSQSTFFFSSD